MILPGIKFTAESSPVDDFLPRMDITAFVGLASLGPVHLPVVLEDEHQFVSIFGPDLNLMWDPYLGRMQTAYLGPAVRAFFRAGGQRCWVVRAAKEDATFQWFPVPGMAGVVLSRSNIDSPPQQTCIPVPAHVRARSRGSGSDSVTVQTLLIREGFGQAKSHVLPASEQAPYQITVPYTAGQQLREDDLLQLRYPSGDLAAQDEIIGFFPIKSVAGPSQDNTITVYADHFVCLRRCLADETPHHIRLLNKIKPCLDQQLWKEVDAKTVDGSPPEPGSLRLVYSHDPELALPQKDTVLPVRWSEAGSPPEDQFGLLIVRNVTIEQENGNIQVAIEPQNNAIWKLIEPVNGLEDLPSCPYVERIRFKLSAGLPERGHKSLYNLGFLDGHPRSWRNLETDDQFYHAPDDPEVIEKKSNDLSVEARQKELPLAAPQIVPEDAQGTKKSPESQDKYIWFPLGMNESLFSTVETYAAGDTDPETALVRDGLQYAVGMDEFFLDQDLAPVSAETLESQAVHNRYVGDKEKHGQLSGIHSLYFIDEITLLSVPDAVQRGWRRCPPTQKLPDTSQPAPKIESVSLDKEAGVINICWRYSVRAGQDDNCAEDIEFDFQHASDPQFLDIADTHSIRKRCTGPTCADQTRKQSIDIPCPGRCEPHHYFRVRTLYGSRTSPWSNTAHLDVANGFLDCGDKVPSPPVAAISQQNGTPLCLLSWEDNNADCEYQIQSSFDPLFRTAEDDDAGTSHQFEITPHHNKIRYYRVRAKQIEPQSHSINAGQKQQSLISPWSNTAHLLPLQKTEWRLYPEKEYHHDALMKIHCAMLRMARSRGDLVSILSLPEHYQSRNAIDYTNRLNSEFDDKILSYGAVYHPWPLGIQRETDPIAIPPDGIACGVIAQSSIRRGAWVAPANIVVPDTIALTQIYNQDETTRLFEAQVNLITDDSRGFLVYNAVTLSPDNALKPLNVRRLLILLRRLAIREGMQTTFDPNNESTRRLIERIFERTLTDLYTRGAFQGNTPAQAFRVIVNASNNTRQSIDQGRLMVDLKVAPSQPLKFLTIRLVQSENGGSRVAEIE